MSDRAVIVLSPIFCRSNLVNRMRATGWCCKEGGRGSLGSYKAPGQCVVPRQDVVPSQDVLHKVKLNIAELEARSQ